MATGNKKTCNAQYWAVGYTNGGANETRLGPFAEQSDAIKAGMVEQGKARGFTLSGVVDGSGKYVYSNAKACNAKFKVGDRVKFWVFDKKADGTVKKVVGEKVTVDDGKGNEVEFPAKDLEVWNAETKNPAACTNSVVANAMAANGSARNGVSVFEYGVGDIVRLRSGRKAEVIAKYADKNGDIKIDIKAGGTRYTVTPEEVGSVIKTDAMAARNALERFSVGDRVYVSRIVDKRKGIVGGDYGIVIKAGPGIYSDVRLDSGETLKEVAEPDMRHARNSEGAVARNSEAYDVAYKAGNLFKDAYEALAGCEHYLERLSTLGRPNDVKGNDAKTAAWAKDKLRKVSDLKSKLDQGRL